jgi:hypothetical protein
MLRSKQIFFNAEVLLYNLLLKPLKVAAALLQSYKNEQDKILNTTINWLAYF